jgi:hypothetical protein
MGKDNGNAPKPVFDLSQVNRNWRKRWVETTIRVTELQAGLLDGKQPDVGDLVAQRLWALEQVGVMREIQALADDQTRLLAMVLVSVPREWLSSDAPEELDWHDPESLGYVLEARYGELVQALTIERRENSKN